MGTPVGPSDNPRARELREHVAGLLQGLVRRGGGSSRGVAALLAAEGYVGRVGNPRHDPVCAWLRDQENVPPFYMWMNHVEVALRDSDNDLMGRSVLVSLPDTIKTLLLELDDGQHPQLNVLGRSASWPQHEPRNQNDDGHNDGAGSAQRAG